MLKTMSAAICSSTPGRSAPAPGVAENAGRRDDAKSGVRSQLACYYLRSSLAHSTSRSVSACPQRRRPSSRAPRRSRSQHLAQLCSSPVMLYRQIGAVRNRRLCPQENLTTIRICVTYLFRPDLRHSSKALNQRDEEKDNDRSGTQQESGGGFLHPRIQRSRTG